MLSPVNCIPSTSAREKTQVKRQHLVEGVLFVLLVLVGAQTRIWLQDLPNFAPVAGLALFAGYFFRSWLLALCLPLSVMAISDLSIGGYDWRMMAIVYSMLAVPVAFRAPLRRYLNLDQGGVKSASLAVTGLVGCSLGASLLFFLTTNFGSWLWFNMYEHSWAGLVQCYAMAIPFFRYTLCGDLFFAVVLFGSYAVAAQFRLAAQARSVPAAE
jgi:hypothetical protein